MKARIQNLFFLILALSISLFAFLGETKAQVSSAAFDPNCYFPRIGVPTEIDTIYGAYSFNYLGAGMLNIRPKPGNSYGIMDCYISPDSTDFTTGPSFDLHNLQFVKQLVFPPRRYIYRFGHFHSTKYRDILSLAFGQGPPRIYWQDDEGNYDTSRYTELTSKLKGKIVTDYSIMKPYTAHISSDSVEDIICAVLITDTLGTLSNPVNFLYFKGGHTLFERGISIDEDSSMYFGKMEENSNEIRDRVRIGDFSGMRREGLIVSDFYDNLFYFKNEKPFSMSSFSKALKYDTVFAQWQNPQSLLRDGGIVMQSFLKSSSDSSYDFLPYFVTKYGNRYVREYRIFKGGKDFGSHRWMADSAAFVLHEPYYYDASFQNMSFGDLGAIKNCGDMTGTGNNVLYIEGTLDAGFYGYEYFYVLGDALDDKVDMFIGPIPNTGGAGSYVDTLVADSDRFQDILMGEAGYSFEGGTAGAFGSIFLVHGTDKIPVKTNRVNFTVSKSNDIKVFPNPATNGKLTIDFHLTEQQDVRIQVWDLLGRKVYSEQIYASFLRSSHHIFLHSFSSGSYILEVSGKAFSNRMQIQIIN